jgi:site-specific DNA recombinase
MKKGNGVKYFLYARKSTEDKKRQIQSIPDQINKLKQLAKDFDLRIIGEFQESKSAMKPNNRPMFNEMLERIEKREADGVLCWDLSRLSRNPVDSGKLSWLSQQGIIKSIQTATREYLPDDNVILFNVETGGANQYILDLRKNVMRGTISKAEKGWSPNLAPLGYLNKTVENTEEKIIASDPDRFPLIRKMWDLMLTGAYTPPQILEIANKEWGFRTRRTKSQGDKELSRSGIYKIFTNLFYTGAFEYFGKLYAGKHEPLVTMEEYDRVQVLLGRKGRPRPQKHEFAFTGVIRCAECGCLYTAENKKKFIKSTGEVRQYNYYHCTRRRKDYACPQRGAVKEEDLMGQIEQVLEKYTILPEFRDWALAILNQKNDSEIEARSKIHETQCASLLKTQRELDNLTKMRYRDLIDDDQFVKDRDLLQAQINELKDKLRATEARAEQWLELTEQTFNFATYARKAFVTGDLQTRKEILMAIGKNQIISDGKLSIEVYDWLKPIGENYPKLEKEYLKRLEPTENGDSKANNQAKETVRTGWLGDRDLNPDTQLQRLQSYR